jgi:ubiquinone/menaquinone biosynthesis C-methylase UbiE
VAYPHNNRQEIKEMITQMENAQSQTPDLVAIKGRQQQTWASGDFDRVAATITITGELLCEAVDIHPGQKVLDVATGSGNTAIAAARRFADAVGVDYVPSLLDRARERAASERLNIAFSEGDAENIPFPDASFDVVLSTFGSMFAPDQEKAASELLRVCKPGGKIGMANWTPEGFIGELFRINARYVPPPPGVRPPVLWGREERLRELFGDGISSLQVTRRTFQFRYMSADHWIDFWRTYYGPTFKTFAALDEASQKSLADAMRELVGKYNRSGDDTMVVPSEYLEVVATRR